MVDIARAKPHALRIAVAAASILAIFLFFDPIGFASSSMAHRIPGRSNSVTHIVLYQFKKTADPAAIDVACATMLALQENCVLPNSQNHYIRKITGGKDNSNERLQNGLTHAFVIRFGSTNDRDYYIEHDPAHAAFKKEVDPLVEKVTVLDFTNGKF